MTEIKTVHTRHGDMQIYADDYYVGRSLDLYGEYSPDETALFAKIVKPGWTVYDVGANIGALTLPLAEMVGERGAVIAIEPQPENFALLKENCAPFPRATIVEKALGDEDGCTRVDRVEQIGGMKNYGGAAVGKGGHFVELLKLDTLVAGGNVDFIKIDVEGAEEQVLAGAAETIARCRPILYVEDHPDRGADNSLLRALWKLGYKIWAHVPPLFSPENHNSNTTNAFPNTVNFNVLCIPKEKVEDYREVTEGLRLKVAPANGTGKWACLCRFGGVGDNLIAASVMRPLKQAGYKVEVITCKPHNVVFENNPFIDKLTVKNTKRDLPQNDQLAWNNWFRARSGEYELFANVSHTCELSLALLPSQTQYWWPPAFRRKICGHNYLEFVHDLFGMPHEFGPLFFPTDEEKEAALDTKRRIGAKKLIGWCLVGTRPDKVHPQAPMAIARVIRELDANVVMFGGPPPRPDHEFARQIQDHVKNQNGDDKGLHEAISPDAKNETWGIRRVLAMASVCDLVIGPDTGPMWGVAFESMPKVVMLSHVSVENVAKHWVNTTSLHADPAKVPCWPCHLLHDGIETCQETQERAGMKVDYENKGAACMLSITVEQVVNAIKKGLEHGRRIHGDLDDCRSASPSQYLQAAE